MIVAKQAERPAVPAGRWIPSRRLALLGTISVLAGTPVLAGETPPSETGAALFQRHCSHCHGFNMVTPGTIAPDLRQFPHDAHSRFVTTVTAGKNNRMPPWGDVLTPEQIEALWNYVRSGGSA